MSLSDAMFEASSVYFQYVNERAAHVKIDPVYVPRSEGPPLMETLRCQYTYKYDRCTK